MTDGTGSQPHPQRRGIAGGLYRFQVWLDRVYVATNRRLRGWPSLFFRTGRAFSKHNGQAAAASLGYYGLFSFFPLMLLLIAAGGALMTPTEAKQAALDLVGQYAPGLMPLLSKNVEEILRQWQAIGAVAAISLLWSSSGVFGAIYGAVNRAWGEMRPQPVWQSWLVALGMTLLVGLLFFLNMVLTAALSIIQTWRLPVLGWQVFLDPGVIRLLGWVWALISLAVSIAIFVLIYKTLPRGPVAWRDVWLGGIAAGIAWQVAKLLFTWYLGLGRYNLVYGSLGAIVAFLFWTYLSATILLLGAELTAQYAHWRRAGRPIDDRLPREM